MSDLPELLIKNLGSTRDYLREVALVLGALQRGFLPPQPRDWQHGLEVGLRGLATQEFVVGDEPTRATLDLVKYKVRLGGSKWPLHEYGAPEILNNVKAWLASRGASVRLDEPEFTPGVAQFDTAMVDAYAQALWWLNEQFIAVKAGLSGGVTSPILLYPHHFDLSLTWFPHDDARQLALGWSTGDETIAEPYLYLTAYPEPAGFGKLPLPSSACWQSDGFSGAILLYKDLAASPDPKALFAKYADLLPAAAPLFG